MRHLILATFLAAQVLVTSVNYGYEMSGPGAIAWTVADQIATFGDHATLFCVRSPSDDPWCDMAPGSFCMPSDCWKYSLQEDAR